MKIYEYSTGYDNQIHLFEHDHTKMMIMNCGITLGTVIEVYGGRPLLMLMERDDERARDLFKGYFEDKQREAKQCFMREIERIKELEASLTQEIKVIRNG